MNRHETEAKVNAIMDELGARRLAIFDGPNPIKEPNGSEMHIWGTRSGCVIVQYWRDGGCSCYVESRNTSWEAFEAEMKQLTAEVV